MTDDVQDLRDTIVPKSDQLNADDLLTGPITAKITRVSRGNSEQPVNIHLEGHRPWRPCKGMRRVLIAAWGNDGASWVGRSVTLYRNPEVMYGGVKVGGIEVSHLSDLSERMAVALTVTRGKRRIHTIEPLRVEQPRPAASGDVEWLKAQDQSLVQDERKRLFGGRKMTPDDVPALRAAVEARMAQPAREPGDESDEPNPFDLNQEA